MKKLYLTMITLLTGLFLMSCNSKMDTVSLESAPYSSSASFSLVNSGPSLAINGTQPALNVSGINSFKFCITQVKLEGSEGADTVEARLGLISPNDGGSIYKWGEVELLDETKISRLKVEVHSDPELCGVAYSMEMNGNTLTRDLEFTFNFSSEIVSSDGSAYSLDLAPIASQFKTALDANQLTDELISSYLQNLEASGYSK